MERWKADMGRVREKRGLEERRVEERRIEERRLEERKGKSQKKEDTGARNVRKVAKHCIFPMVCGSGAPFSDHFWMHAVVARSTFTSQNAQNTPCSHCWKFRCQKIAHRCGPKHISNSKCWNMGVWALLEDQTPKNADPALSACPHQNAQDTSGSDRFWKIRYKRTTRRCGAKHMSHVQVQMHRPLLEDQTPKKCTSLWHEAHFQVK